MAAKRKSNEDALLLALACGATVEAAARQCGIAERTAYRRLQDPQYANRLRELRSEMATRATGALTAASTESVRTLLHLQKESQPPAVRLGAARAVLEVARCSTGDWENAVVQGFAVWREIKKRGGGTIVADLEKRTLTIKEG